MNIADSGLVSNIQKLTVHDGPGIRTLIFMKGCPLHCLWCSNPETQNPFPEIAYIQNKCISNKGCRLCIQNCPNNAISIKSVNEITIDRNICDHCGECASACPSNALQLWGEYKSLKELIDICEEDRPYYWRSGGGVTIGGGEPLFQHTFVSKLLFSLKERGIHTAIETCGFANWDQAKFVFKYADLIFFDIKHINSTVHLALTGVTNEKIIDNFNQIVSNFPQKPVIVRTPIIPGINDSKENISEIVQFLSKVTSIKYYEMLPYHALGKDKYLQLGKDYPLNIESPPSPKQMAQLRRQAKESLESVV